MPFTIEQFDALPVGTEVRVGGSDWTRQDTTFWSCADPATRVRHQHLRVADHSKTFKTSELPPSIGDWFLIGNYFYCVMELVGDTVLCGLLHDDGRSYYGFGTYPNRDMRPDCKLTGDRLPVWAPTAATLLPLIRSGVKQIEVSNKAVRDATDQVNKVMVQVRQMEQFRSELRTFVGIA